MESELKPCPFCGDSKHLEMDEDYSGDRKNPHYMIYCEGCNAIGPFEYTKEDAKGAWNVRRADGK